MSKSHKKVVQDLKVNKKNLKTNKILRKQYEEEEAEKDISMYLHTSFLSSQDKDK